MVIYVLNCVSVSCIYVINVINKWLLAEREWAADCMREVVT